MTELCHFMTNTGIATNRTVRGCTDSEIAEIERRLSVRFPVAVAECLRHMGHACGQLMDGDAFGLNAFEEAQEVAHEITSEVDSPWQLPDALIPFQQHDGYVFLFLYSNVGEDPPVWQYIETECEPKLRGLSFTAWLRELAIAAIEHKPWNEEVCREIRLHRDDWMSRKKTLDEFDNEASQIRRSLIARIVQSDCERGCITNPIEMQQFWNSEFPNYDLYHRLKLEQKRIPWGWVNPRDA